MYIYDKNKEHFQYGLQLSQSETSMSWIKREMRSWTSLWSSTTTKTESWATPPERGKGLYIVKFCFNQGYSESTLHEFIMSRWVILNLYVNEINLYRHIYRYIFDLIFFGIRFFLVSCFFLLDIPRCLLSSLEVWSLIENYENTSPSGICCSTVGHWIFSIPGRYT